MKITRQNIERLAPFGDGKYINTLKIGGIQNQREHHII